MPEGSPEVYNPEDPTQRAMMESVHELSQEAQKQYFDERNPDFLNYAGFNLLLDRRLTEVTSPVQQEQTPFLRVVFADFNGLKEINDRYGHEAGDKALAAVIDVFKQFNPAVKDRPLYLDDFSRQPVVAARHTKGDEFALFMSGIGEAEADRTLAILKQEIAKRTVEVTAGSEVPLSLSFGYSDWQRGKNRSALLSEADQAMYQEKRENKSSSSENVL